MAFEVFGYREEEPRAGSSPIVRPTLNLRLASLDQQILVRSLVDTGSPSCIFGRAIADALEIDMSAGAGPDRELKILGGTHSARIAMVELELPPFVGRAWEAECCFLYGDLDLSFQGVLGNQGFLDRWVASFNYYDGYFVIEERDTFVQRLGVDPLNVLQGDLDSEWDRPTVN